MLRNKALLFFVIICFLATCPFSTTIASQWYDNYNLANENDYAFFRTKLEDCAKIAGSANEDLKDWFNDRAIETLEFQVELVRRKKDGKNIQDSSLSGKFKGPNILGAGWYPFKKMPIKKASLTSSEISQINDNLIACAKRASDLDIRLVEWFLDQSLKIIEAIRQKPEIVKDRKNNPYPSFAYCASSDQCTDFYVWSHVEVMAEAIKRGAVVDLTIQMADSEMRYNYGGYNLIHNANNFLFRLDRYLNEDGPENLKEGDMERLRKFLEANGTFEQLEAYESKIDDIVFYRTNRIEPYTYEPEDAVFWLDQNAND